MLIVKNFVNRFALLDYGRFAAALTVMIFHYIFSGIQNGKLSSLSYITGLVPIAKYGYLGVEFFFMISGYVIFSSAKGKTPGEFCVSRAVRLYPAFWVAVIFTTILAQFWGGEKMHVGFYQAAANLTMLPSLVGEKFVDGVYWSLQYELSFYVLVASFLFFGFYEKLTSFFIAWPLLMLLARFAQLSHLPFAGGYYNYFAAGAIFAILRSRRDILVVGSAFVSLLLCIEYSAGKAVMLSRELNMQFSGLIIGGLILTQFCFFIALNSSRGSRVTLPGSRLIGGLTYPIYLIHAHAGYMMLSRFGTNETRFQAYAGMMLLVFGISFLIHVYVEKRFSRFWNCFFESILGAPIDALSIRLCRLVPVGLR